MKTLVLKYPGDPAFKCEEMTRAEFFNRFPPDDRVVTVSNLEDGKLVPKQEIAMNTEIHCDNCYADPGDDILLVRNSRVYCRTCRSENLEPYLKEK